MDNNLAMHIPITPLQPAQGFVGAASLGNATVGEYWRWAYSDIVGNTSRGLLAQFIVATALGDTRPVVDIWAPYDVIAEDGTTIEVKSAAYLQSWGQTKFSRIQFQVPETWEWDAVSGEYVGAKPRRQAETYVFAVLSELDKARLNPLDSRQWEFYVVATSVLDKELGETKSLSLPVLKRMAKPVPIDDLRSAVGAANS